MVFERNKQAVTSTQHIVWNMAWRGQFWGAFTGLVAGALYGYLGLILIILPSLVVKDPSFWLAETIWEELVFFLLGIPVGGTIGLGLGWMVGLVGGLLVGFWTANFFNPISTEKTYRISMRILSIIIIVISSFILIYVVDPFEIISKGYYFDVWETLVVFVFPLLIAIFAANWISQKLANWYINEMPGVK